MRKSPPRRITVGPSRVCIGFEPPLAVGTQYGAPAGHSSGDEVLVTSGIGMSVHDFNLLNGSTTFNEASIDVAPVAFGSNQSLRLNNINVEFDFTGIGALVQEVDFEFLDLGGHENLSVNGSPVFVGELSSIGGPLNGVMPSVTSTPVSGGQAGRVVLTGAIERVRIGGQELWIDNVCARAGTEQRTDKTRQ